MNKGGRPRVPVWIHFDEVSKDVKSYARCKKCCHELFSKVGRMKAHNQKCNDEGDKEVNVKEEVICSAPEKRQRDDSPPPTKKWAVSLQQPVEHHFTKTTSAEKESFGMETAKFFFILATYLSQLQNIHSSCMLLNFCILVIPHQLKRP